MTQFDKTKQLLAEQRSVLQSKYAVKKLGIFGSVARGDQEKDSDLDVLVEFSQPISLFQFLELEEQLSLVTGRRVDLVSKRALKPAIKKAILAETIYV